MNRLYQSSLKLRFRRFSHKAYAAFCSLHREVSIGRIAAYMTDLEMLKHGKSAAAATLLLVVGMTPVQADEGIPDDSVPLNRPQLSLQEVLVVAHKAEVHSEAFRLVTRISNEQIQALPVQTVADILRYLPGIDVRTRGANGAQADISMRGGTFDQVLVMLNGVSLNDCQTGHYALNLPVTPAMIERIEVLQGTSAALFGAFSGAVNIVTGSLHRTSDTGDPGSEVLLGVSSGMNGLAHPEIAASAQCREVMLNVAADYARADGYDAPRPTGKEQTACRNSDYQLANVYLQTRWRDLDVQAGAQWKDAGLGMGYGFGSQDQFDATRTAFASARYAHRLNAWRIEAQAAYRTNYDRYEWHRGQVSNRHWNHTADASLAARYASRAGTTAFGVGVRNEHIRSTHLGNHNRLHARWFASQTFYYAGLSASVGVNGSYNTSFGYHMGGDADIGYTWARHGSLFLHAGRSLRMPTFTDLHYNAGNQLGNPDLKPEEAWLVSVGYKGAWSLGSGARGTLSVSADGYYRRGRNIIDWIYTPEDTLRPYHAANQQQMNAAGAELSVAYRWNEWLRCVAVDYAYTFLDINLKESGSRYLDYLSHKLTLRLEHGIYRGIGAAWTVRFQKREGQYNDAQGEVHDYQPVWLLDGSVYWQNSYLRVSADCTNMTHTRYYDYGGVLQPGAWAKITVRAQL